MFSQYEDYIKGGAIAIALHSPRGTTAAITELGRIHARYAYEMAKWGVRHFPAKAAREIAVRTGVNLGRRAGQRALAVGVVAKHPVVGVALVASVIASARIQEQIRQASPDKQTLLVSAYTGQHAGLPPQPLGVML